MSISGHVSLDGSNNVITVNLNDKAMEAIKAKVIADGISWPFVNIGVVDLPADEVRSRKVFEFAKKWGIPILVAEPAPDALDTVEKLCKEYHIKVAIHDHARPNHYWNPDVVLAAVKGRTPLMGACPDIGHWMESGLDPLECLKKFGWSHYLSALQREQCAGFKWPQRAVGNRGRQSQDLDGGTEAAEISRRFRHRI